MQNHASNITKMLKKLVGTSFALVFLFAATSPLASTALSLKKRRCRAPSNKHDLLFPPQAQAKMSLINSIPITIGQINRSDRNTKITAAMTNAVFPTALTATAAAREATALPPILAAIENRIKANTRAIMFILLSFCSFWFPFLVCPAVLCFKTF